MNNSDSLRRRNGAALLNAALIVGLFFAGNLRNTIVGEAVPHYVGWLEVALDAVLVTMGLLVLRRTGRLSEVSRLWPVVWPALPFIAIALCSLLWTIDRSATLFRVLILVLSSVLGMYLALQFSLPRLMNLLAGFFALLIVVTVTVAILLPDVGMMNFAPYTGSWRGLMWHRNYLGTAMALASLVFLCGLLRLLGMKDRPGALSVAKRTGPYVFYAVFYLAAVALVWLSHSATGVILLFVLHGEVACVLLWLRWYPRLRLGHYAALAALAVGGMLLAYGNRDKLLGLLGRDSTFTGRAGMWEWLFKYVVAQRPLLGHGFGALWYQNDFRLAVQAGVSWGFPVVIGDNGYIDIILHVGYLGALVFAFLLLAILYYAVRLAFHERTLLTFMPLLIMTYVLIVNITLSYFLETESYTWLIMMALWGASVLRLERGAVQPVTEGQVAGRAEPGIV